MEWFAETVSGLDEAGLKQKVTMAALPDYCASIDNVLEDNGDEGRIYCIWGTFEVLRQEIRGGVRFTLPHCPNAFTWAITTGFPPDPGKTVIHAVINRKEHEADFLETIEEFVADWAEGLTEPT